MTEPLLTATRESGWDTYGTGPAANTGSNTASLEEVDNTGSNTASLEEVDDAKDNRSHQTLSHNQSQDCDAPAGLDAGGTTEGPVEHTPAYGWWGTFLRLHHPRFLFGCRWCSRRGQPDGFSHQTLSEFKIFFNWVAVLRVINMLFWCALVVIYVLDVNRKFKVVGCHAPTMWYCSNDFLYDTDTCHFSHWAVCHPLSQVASWLVIAYLTLAQFFVFRFRMLAFLLSNRATQRWSGAVVFLGLCMHAYLFLLWVMEALVLPMGTQEGDVAFPEVTFHGLEISMSVAILAKLYTIYWRLWGTNRRWDPVNQQHQRTDSSSRALRWFLISYLVVFVHIMVILGIYIHEHWRLLNESLFVMRWEKERITYRTARTLFTVTTVAESYLRFIYFNSERVNRLQLSQFAQPVTGTFTCDATRSRRGVWKWARSLLLWGFLKNYRDYKAGVQRARGISARRPPNLLPHNTPTTPDKALLLEDGLTIVEEHTNA